MKNTGFCLTDWLFFFNSIDKSKIKSLLNNEKNSGLQSEFITWKIITVFLPVVAFSLAFILNFITNAISITSFFKFFNNGSLPIIAFGILTSGMPYLLERLVDFPEYHIIRRRVMALALVFLFLSAAFYILQTLEIITKSYSVCTNWILTILSFYSLAFSVTIGYKMYLLQSSNIIDYATDINTKVQDLGKSLDDL